MLLSKILKFHPYAVNILLFIFSLSSFSKGLPFQKFFLQNCYTVAFRQENFFEGEIDTYKGVLIRKGKRIDIYYFTKPLFFIKADENYIELGYTNGEVETYERDDYKNPILEVLLNLDRLSRYFLPLKVEGDIYILKPKGELGDYIQTVKVAVDKNGFPKEIEVSSGADNYSRIYIKSFKNICNFKIKNL